ncbi:MAG: NUDIX domain-containing protein, partial [Aliifodinibius sp.]|nr:NUDIX domain-containing protein [Fodinibius sp.]NIV11567.1 NUDIX domain-containing protein [Fodinibius sp.]NIY26837.1 NUDIX domain-containing protein [Fodinibius sp.]
KYDDWSLPKGKLNSDETWRSAAVREVQEETSITPVIHNLAGVMTYPIEHRFKIVFYWRMNVAQEKPFKPNDEIDKIQWVNEENFSTTLTYPSEIKFILNAKIF